VQLGVFGGFHIASMGTASEGTQKTLKRRHYYQSCGAAGLFHPQLPFRRGHKLPFILLEAVPPRADILRAFMLQLIILAHAGGPWVAALVIVWLTVDGAF
jgi:hypothetical protein